jgi:thiamine-monophosphate kinase
MRLFSASGLPTSVQLGIGDDAAIIRAGREHWVWTIDACVEGVHFDQRWLLPQHVGWKSFHAAASDIAAMGARPVAALCSVALPKNCDLDRMRSVARGQARAARSLGCAIIGGNLTSARELSIHTTLLGTTNRPLQRNGARAGDEIWLLGQVGAAGAGLEISRSVSEEKRTSDMRWCVRSWQRPKALVDAGYGLRTVAHAAIDVSDGLAADLQHLAKASSVRAVLRAESIDSAVGPRLRRVAKQLNRSVLDWALFGGEDYALLAAGAPHQRPVGAIAIGRFETGRGVWLQTANKTRRLSPVGFDHFKKRGA